MDLDFFEPVVPRRTAVKVIGERCFFAEYSPRTVEEHDKMRERIYKLDTLKKCVKVYESAKFQECVDLLHESQARFVVYDFTVEAKEKWAKEWALGLSRHEKWALALNLCRRTSLLLLYKVCDLATTVKDVKNNFEKRRVSRILYPCVVMDRANCLYNLEPDQTGKIVLGRTGLGWYGEEDEAAYRALGDLPLPPNPDSQHTINKRLLWLQRNLYLDDEMLKKWLTVAAPPRLHRLLRTHDSDIKVDLLLV